MNDSLCFYSANTLSQLDLPDVKKYRSLFYFINSNISFIDRTGTIQIPFRTYTPDHLKIPSYDPNFSLTYEDCCLLQAQSILKKQEELDVPIRILYSGGIDSSVVLTSFINVLGLKEAEKRIEIYMSVEGMEENPWMWEKILRRSNFKLLDSEKFVADNGRDRILIGGECNDQVCGAEPWKSIIMLKGEDILSKPWTESGMIEYYLHQGVTEEEAIMWTEIFGNHARNAPCPVETYADWFWWINFSCKWASVYYRKLSFARDVSNINDSYLQNYYYQFFNNDNFQRWSMRNGEIKSQGGWKNYKWQAKQFVAKLCGEEFNKKIKKVSLWRLMVFNPGAKAIDNNYNFIKNLNPVEWYNPNNSFNN